jgi:hypothetical protein
MSTDSVDRNIKDLVAAKFLTVVKDRGSGPHQKPNTYRLNLDLEALEKHLGRNRLYKPPAPQEAAQADEAPEGVSEVSEPPPAGPQSGPQIPLDLGRSLGRTGAALTEEPKRTGEPARASARDPQDDLFQEWWEAYPQQGHGFSKDWARQAWRGLSPDDRKLALRAAQLIGPKSRMGRGKPKEPYYWLHDRVFATIAEEHGWTNGAPPPTPRKVFVEEDTPQWEAWAKTRPGKPFPKGQAPGHRNQGWWFDSEWPAGARVA